jgi:tetratricopeptide (TPR) repeat protein
MSHSPRLEELRRRVQADPTSIAFAALAEEYRRAGHFEDAIEVCRTGLKRHPAYVSARVTLGRALIEINELEEAESELAEVLKIAPENLAAIRAQAEIHARKSARHAHVAAAIETKADPAAFEFDLIGPTPRLATRPPVEVPSSEMEFPIEVVQPPDEPPAALGALERFLDGILARKARRLTAF